ncbi:hypothetical protein [Mycobacterium sp.]|uniref:hypothetical protein n=1 Tax=Mycobacterium sp. TaxID=1785 RepID=UPI00127B4973|nr:hypothetical protein [Mycobacterium sp.]KAA8957034.1 MAG: hypothetical protein F6Q13_16715 [Mycobacterium sp.]
MVVKLRLATLGLVTGGASLLALMSIVNSVMAFGDSADIGPADPTIGLVMGGSGEPIPGTEYVDTANTLYRLYATKLGRRVLIRDVW